MALSQQDKDYINDVVSTHLDTYLKASAGMSNSADRFSDEAHLVDFIYYLARNDIVAPGRLLGIVENIAEEDRMNAEGQDV